MKKNTKTIKNQIGKFSIHLRLIEFIPKNSDSFVHHDCISLSSESAKEGKGESVSTGMLSMQTRMIK